MSGQDPPGVSPRGTGGRASPKKKSTEEQNEIMALPRLERGFPERTVADTTGPCPEDFLFLAN